MKAKELKAMLDAGVFPFVVLQDNLWDESFGEKGMIAKVVSYTQIDMDTDRHDYSFEFDYMSHKAHNLSLQAHDWLVDYEKNIIGTAIEAGHIKENNLREDVVYEEDYDIPVVLQGNGNALYEEFALSNPSGTYVEWLEERVMQEANARKIAELRLQELLKKYEEASKFDLKIC